MGEEGKTDADYERENIERQRQSWHHEVFCLVLKARAVADPLSPKENVQLARDYADLAYPPPKVKQ